MNVINPEKLAVSVYRSTDANAPKLDKTADCVATIFKACLVTGYGDKQSAGWQLAFENLTAKVKVIRPPATAKQDFFLRLSGDTGQVMKPQVYISMTDINTGDLKLDCATTFKYGAAPTTGNWVLIATNRGFWFFCETSNGNGIPTNQSGSYLYCGGTAKNTAGVTGLYLKHTGGSWGDTDDDRYHIFDQNTNGATIGKLYNPFTRSVTDVSPTAFFTGSENATTNKIASPVFLKADNEMWGLPAIAPSKNNSKNYDLVQIDGLNFINHSTATISAINNFYVPIDYWEM